MCVFLSEGNTREVREKDSVLTIQKEQPKGKVYSLSSRE